MIGRFSFYRRRRVLPFSAVYALVCINAATLTPFVVSPARAVPSLADDAASAAMGRDFSRDLRYDRGRHVEREPIVAAAVPPLVKNLRRPAPTREAKTAACGTIHRPAASTPTRHDLANRLFAANEPNLSRLCRLLL